MNSLTPQQMARAQQLALGIQQHLQTNPAALAKVRASGLGQYLQEGDSRLRTMLTQPRSKALLGVEGPGEFAGVLYQLHQNFGALAAMLELPQPTVTRAHFAARADLLIGTGFVADNGDIYGTDKYENLDPGWLLSVANYIWTLLWGPAAFGTTPAQIKAPPGKSLRIALVGDWGTGIWPDGDTTCPAAQIASQLTRLGPFDYTIHLGDVYYSGEISEEAASLELIWPAGTAGSLALNSNHEMYSGGSGYFDALSKPQFSIQQNTSYFSIENDGWVILGLDSAYPDSSLLYMTGDLNDAYQPAFAQASLKAGKKVLALTHHNGLELAGGSQTPLWAAMKMALGRLPDCWYWGHLHQGAVYNNQSPACEGIKVRCLGNGGLPVAEASVMKSNANIVYYEKTHLVDPGEDQSVRIMNGFAILTLGADGSLLEEFYTQDGVLRPSSAAPTKSKTVSPAFAVAR